MATESKHTQGRLEVSHERNGQTIIIKPERGTVALMAAGYQQTRDVDAAELVRRWNAFEPGGEVAEMREALELLETAARRYALGADAESGYVLRLCERATRALNP